MKPPCIIIVSSLLPSLRVLVAKSLINDYGLKPINAAKKMDVTPAAITQYLKGVRGKELADGIFEHKDVRKALLNIVEELNNKEINHTSVLAKICNLCKIVRREGLICEQCFGLSSKLRNTDCTLCQEAVHI